MKKAINDLMILVLSICCFLFSACTLFESEEITINLNSKIFTVGDTFSLSNYIDKTGVYYNSSNEEIVLINGYKGEAIACGDVLVYAYSRIDNSVVASMLVSIISPEPESISISGATEIKTGEITKLVISTKPAEADTTVLWRSNDERIATVDENGNVTGVGIGLVTIEATSLLDTSVKAEYTIWVTKGVTSYDNVSVITSQSTVSVDLSTLSKALEPIIEKGKSSVIGLNGYARLGGTEYLASTASGVIYKRYCVTDTNEYLDDGTIQNFSTYKYYVITNKHLVENMSRVTIYYDNSIYYEDVEIDGEVIAYDTKIDLAVITFTDSKYFPVCEFGDSSECENGEFVVAIGNTYGKDYYQSASFGVVSYNERYVADDTDGDGTNDWDALYIQHDAAVSEGSSGGTLLNMKGEVIGINTLKISEDKIDNMAFAIPSNTVLEIVSLLEQGIVPERPVLGISVLSVKTILKEPSLQTTYLIPSGVTSGMYIASVEKDKVGYKAGLEAGDILVEINGKQIIFSYELRAAINECIIGSGEETTLKVIRNGKELILKAVF